MDRKDGINKNNTILATRLSNVYKKGFELARGEYVIGINSDDYYISYDFLDGAIDFLDKKDCVVSPKSFIVSASFSGSFSSNDKGRPVFTLQ